MSKPNKSTIRILRKLENYILDEPKRFNMNFWGASIDPEFYKLLKNVSVYRLSSEELALRTQKPACGTVGCLAGNLCVMTGKMKPKVHFDGIKVYNFPQNTMNLARRILGISFEDAQKLFMLGPWTVSGHGWPFNFASKLMSLTPGTTRYAQVVIDRIEHYIATGE